jgi:hypothetical protein
VGDQFVVPLGGAILIVGRQVVGAGIDFGGYNHDLSKSLQIYRVTCTYESLFARSGIAS